MRYYFPIHLDGGNRGCEAIAKGTALILGEKKENLVGLCTDMETDRRLGTDKYVTLVSMPKHTLFRRAHDKICRTIGGKGARERIRWKPYTCFIDKMQPEDILVSTGGDMMCYENNEVNYTVNYAHERGIKSILWGCSIGEENLNAEKLAALRKFSVIYTRDPLTKRVLEGHDMKNVVVYPDPAFILEPEACKLPECFSQGNVIGINLSRYVLGGCDLYTPFGREVVTLIEYVMNETDFHILLIPHVFWIAQDDRIVCRAVKDIFPGPRVSLLDSERLNYCQIRYVISNCRMLIAARTHAAISGYATQIPTIALGYSIKSKGVAKAVGMPEWTVVDSRQDMKESTLLAALKRMQDEKDNILSILKSSIPSYTTQLASLKDLFANACNLSDIACRSR